jgi:hypothetical protein
VHIIKTEVILMRIGYLRIKAYITKEETNVDAAAV